MRFRHWEWLSIIDLYSYYFSAARPRGIHRFVSWARSKFGRILPMIASGSVRLMRFAHLISIVLGAIGLDNSRNDYALGKPKSDAVDHVDPWVHKCYYLFSKIKNGLEWLEMEVIVQTVQEEWYLLLVGGLIIQFKLFVYGVSSSTFCNDTLGCADKAKLCVCYAI